MSRAAADTSLTIRDIAELLRCSTDTVRRHHAEWTANAGFPSPVSLAGVRGLRWSRPAVFAWQLQAASGPAGQAATDWAAVAAARSALLVAGIDPDSGTADRASGTADRAGVDPGGQFVPSLAIH